MKPTVCKVVFIHKRSIDGLIQVVNPVGTVLPAHSTGSGKVMLAQLSARELDRLYPRDDLPRLTPNTITSRTALEEESLASKLIILIHEEVKSWQTIRSLSGTC